MAASGNKDKMSEEELKQRQDASHTHGAYALRDRGKSALQGSATSRLEELEEAVHERKSAIELLKEHTAKSVLIAELALGYVSNKRAQGVELENLAVFRALPAFFNSATRALRDLIALLPDDKGVIDAKQVLDELRMSKDDEEGR
jgi:hypothetical protein